MTNLVNTKSTSKEDQRKQEEEEEEEEDPTDIFDTSLSSLFSIPPIAFSTSSPSAPYVYTNPLGIKISLKLPNPPPDLYTKLQANNLWLSGIYLADMIATHRLSPLLQGRVCELGAGAGLPGIAAGLEGCQVVSTDWGVDEVLDVIKGNFERAGVNDYKVVGHEWGTDPDPLLEGGDKFDALLLADTLWVTEAHNALLDSVFALLKPGGVAHIAAGLHTGRGPVDRFLAAARERGGKVQAIKEVRWNRGVWDDYTTNEGVGEERGVVVYHTCTTPSEPC
jgi:predicted nicotinamide N-methyase